MRRTLADALMTARALVPQLKRIAVVRDPPELQPFQRPYMKEFPALATELELIDLTGMPMREVRARVANLPARTAIIYPGMYSDGEGTYLTPVEGLRRFADAANRPIVVTAETQLGPGIGGYIAVPSEIGQATAVQVLRILQGEKRLPSPSARATTSSLFSTGDSCSAGASARARCRREAKSSFGSRLSGSSTGCSFWQSAPCF